MAGRVGTAVLVLLLAGCGITREVRYEPTLFPPVELGPGERLDGKALVLTTPEDDAFVYQGKLRAYTPPSARLKTPLGLQTRQAALRVFGRLFREGADASSEPAAGLERFVAVISPRVTGFTSRTVRENAVFQFEVAVQVTLRKGPGAPVLVRSYDPGTFEYVYAPLEALGRDGAHAYAIQFGLQRVMVEAAEDVRRCLTGGCPARPELPEPAFIPVPPRAERSVP